MAIQLTAEVVAYAVRAGEASKDSDKAVDLIKDYAHQQIQQFVAENAVKALEGRIARDEELRAMFFRLFDKIKHGDQAHQDWLWSEMQTFRNDYIYELNHPKTKKP